MCFKIAKTLAILNAFLKCVLEFANSFLAYFSGSTICHKIQQLKKKKITF